MKHIFFESIFGRTLCEKESQRWKITCLIICWILMEKINLHSSLSDIDAPSIDHASSLPLVDGYYLRQLLAKKARILLKGPWFFLGSCMRSFDPTQTLIRLRHLTTKSHKILTAKTLSNRLRHSSTSCTSFGTSWTFLDVDSNTS